MKEYGLGCSLDEVDIILRALGITIEQVAEQLEPDESCGTKPTEMVIRDVSDRA